MKIKIPQNRYSKWFFIVFACIAVWLSFLSNFCAGPNIVLLDNKKLLLTPNFIGDVWPPPNRHLSMLCYLKSMINWGNNPPTSVAVKIYRTTEIINEEAVDLGTNEEMPRFEDRISFYIDGVKLPLLYQQDSGSVWMIDRKEIPVSGAYVYGYSPFLWYGEHKARLMIKTKSGKILEYEWLFYIY